MKDPRPSGRKKKVGVIAFYYPGYEEECDKLCQAGFLGNFYEFPGGLSLKGLTFTNSEAAFQALKFIQTNHAHEFQNLSGNAAFKKKMALQDPDMTFGGLGNNWKGMQAVLDAKFQNQGLADLLRKTGDTFLLEHNSVRGRDYVWSDNHDGTGTNWLGLQLMILRDKLNHKTNWQFVGRYIDLSTGEPWNDTGKREWQKIVRKANQATMDELGGRSTGKSDDIDIQCSLCDFFKFW